MCKTDTVEPNNRDTRMVKQFSRIFYTLLAVAVTQVVQSAELPSLQTDTVPQYYILKLGGALVLVLFALFAFTFAVKKYNRFQSNSCGMKLIGGMNIGAKEKIIIIEVSGQQLVLGVTPSSINRLTAVNPNVNDNCVNESTNSSNFSESLKRVQQGGSVQ